MVQGILHPTSVGFSNGTRLQKYSPGMTLGPALLRLPSRLTQVLVPCGRSPRVDDNVWGFPIVVDSLKRPITAHGEYDSKVMLNIVPTDPFSRLNSVLPMLLPNCTPILKGRTLPILVVVVSLPTLSNSESELDPISKCSRHAPIGTTTAARNK